jgi:hypothetical protein
MIALLVAALSGAVARRVAGGVIAIPGGTLVARALASVYLGACLWLAFPATPWHLIATIPLLFFMGMAAGFPVGGMVPTSVSQVGGLSQQHGWALIGPMALWAAAYGMTWWPLVLAVVVVGPIYWLATLWQPNLPALGFNKGGLPDPPAWAEPWVGGVMGLGLGMALWGIQ